MRIDGGKVFSPVLHEVPVRPTQAIGSPSVKTGLLEDVYLTLVAAPEDGRAAPRRSGWVVQAADRLALDRWRADGRRHVPRRVAGPSSPAH